MFMRLSNYLHDLDELSSMNAYELSKLLHVTIETSYHILDSYKKYKKIDLLRLYKQSQVAVIPYNSCYYPKSLHALPDKPLILFAMGDVQLLAHEKNIACIGSRQATHYSEQAISFLLPPLIEAGYTIVSGLAKGADILAHKATMYYGGKTIAVLGHGLHMIYPKEHEQIANKMCQQHLLLTEFPLYTNPRKHYFPMRNRIISGLSEALVVTEAAVRSGTTITANLALEQGKDVFAVPGPITSKWSEGTNRLIKEGAIPCSNGYEILQELQMFRTKN